MNRHTTFARRFALVSAGAALTLGSLAGSAYAIDEIANPEPDECEAGLEICDKGPIDPQPEPDDNGFDGPGDITDDPCNHISHGCDDGGDPEIDDLAPETPVPADPTFTG